MSESTLPTLAFMGLGGMGLPMARNLLVAGYPLVAWNRSPQPVQTLVSGGGAPRRHCSSPGVNHHACG